MPQRFDYFVILAGMRTGSNFLEASLNAYSGLKSYGEVFNPAFVGHANQADLYGMDAAAVAADPGRIIQLMRDNTDGLAGFRLFKDHNQVVLDRVLDDPRCAKIVLRRNPIDSFVSLEIVQKTGQWRLADMKNVKTAKVTFDAAKFAKYLADTRAYYGDALRKVHASGQAVFSIEYDQLGEADVINGLARYLGVDASRDDVATNTKKQNPEPLSEKVTNFAQMVQEIAGLDPLSLMHDPSFEPARGAMVGQYLVAHDKPVMFMPIKAGPTEMVVDWLAAIADGQAPTSGFSQKVARQWKRRNTGHRSFCVVRHPVLRAFAAYVTHFVQPGDDHFAGIRDTLSKRYGIEMPDAAPLDQVERAALREGFLGFLGFVKGNLAGQTQVRVDGAWASQSALLKGMAQFSMPDHVFREDDLARDLNWLAECLGIRAADYRADGALQDVLADIYDDAIEQAARAAYQKDYMLFGHGPWRV